MTGDCPGCPWIQNPVGQSRNHTEDCRRRVESELAKTEQGQERLRGAQDRIDHKVVGIIEAQDSGANRVDMEGETNEQPQPVAGGSFENVDHDMPADVMEVDATTATAQEDELEHLHDAAAPSTDIILKTPERAPAQRRGPETFAINTP